MKYLIIILGFIAFISCKQNNSKSGSEHKFSKNIQMLYDSTMNIHDEAMKKMATLEQYQRKISGYLKSFPVNGDQPKEDGIELRKAMGEMNKGEEGMYRWMREFKTNLDSLNEMQQKNYLLLSKYEIQTVSDQINTGLAMGAFCVKKYGLENFVAKPVVVDTSKK